MKLSYSKMQCYKDCRRMYELKYIYGVHPTEQPQPLQDGLSYHEGVEKLISKKNVEIPHTKIGSMLYAFQKHIELPKCDIKTEQPFCIDIGNHQLVGRFDGLGDSFVLEHKTTSSNIDGAYWQQAERSEQILTYCLASGNTEVLYTACKKPTIRQKKNETEEEFFDRCCEWYAEKDAKIGQIFLYKTPLQIERYADILKSTADEIEKCNLFYKNCGHCMKWGRLCEYAPICEEYDPKQDYVGFERKDD